MGQCHPKRRRRVLEEPSSLLESLKTRPTRLLMKTPQLALQLLRRRRKRSPKRLNNSRRSVSRTFIYEIIPQIYFLKFWLTSLNLSSERHIFMAVFHSVTNASSTSTLGSSGSQLKVVLPASSHALTHSLRTTTSFPFLLNFLMSNACLATLSGANYFSSKP